MTRTSEPSPQSSSPPSTEKLTELRAAVFTDGMKQLVLVNGGGAVALLAFLQAIWSTEPKLARVVLLGTGWMLSGVIVLLPIPFIRVLHSNAAEKIRNKNPDANTRTRLWYFYNALPYVSALAFAVGVGQLEFAGLALQADQNSS